MAHEWHAPAMCPQGNGVAMSCAGAPCHGLHMPDVINTSWGLLDPRHPFVHMCIASHTRRTSNTTNRSTRSPFGAWMRPNGHLSREWQRHLGRLDLV